MDKTFEEITKKLTDHFDSKPLIIVERYNFHKREQSSRETLAEHVAELRRLTTKCNFGTHLDDALQDRFVCGIKNEQIHRGPLAEADLDLAGALIKAIAMEAAHSHSQVLKTPLLSVGKIEQSVQDRQPTGGGRSGSCHRCGLTGHHARECRFRESICHRCSHLS